MIISDTRDGGDGPSNTPSNLIIGDFTRNRTRSERVTNPGQTHNSLSSRADVQYLSQVNDPFTELATRLTDFFSESESNKAQEIKKACWDDLTEEKKPVFEPNFGNLRNAKFSKNPEGLTITLSQDHVEQGYLQVLADLTLVAEVIKRLIDNRTEDCITGFNAHPVEKIKIISHPDRNLLIPLNQIKRNLDYKIGPEFKLIESKSGLTPVASGMFNLDDVQANKLKTPSDNNSHLGDLAFNARTENPLQEMYDLRTAYLTASNKIFLTPLNNSRGTNLVMEGFGYDKPNQELEDLVGQHNKGRIYNNDISSVPLRRDIGTTSLDPDYRKALREMSDYELETPNKILHRSPEALSHRQIGPLVTIDALQLFKREIAVVAPDGTWIIPGYALDNVDHRAIHRIVQ
jgi:hypothetical protein